MTSQADCRQITRVNVMIEITMTEKATTELLKVMKQFSAQSIRLIQQGFG